MIIVLILIIVIENKFKPRVEYIRESEVIVLYYTYNGQRNRRIWKL